MPILQLVWLSDERLSELKSRCLKQTLLHYQQSQGDFFQAFVWKYVLSQEEITTMGLYTLAVLFPMQSAFLEMLFCLLLRR